MRVRTVNKRYALKAHADLQASSSLPSNLAKMPPQSRSLSIDYHATLKSQRSALITVIDLNDWQLVLRIVTGFEGYRSPLV